MRTFLCDQMCVQLGRWLRTAGYDTRLIEEPIPDVEIYQIAQKEGRILLTKDKYFRGKEGVIILEGWTLEEWIEQLKTEGVNWLNSPFTRCLECNTPLEQKGPQYWICSKCGRLYWHGSHTENMIKRLENWQQEPTITLGLGGDLMIGRLVDEFLEEASPDYIWGNLHPYLQATDFNFVNLETTLTNSEETVPKVFNFKAKPDRIRSLKVGPIHAVNLANNHILDFSESGLLDTIHQLDKTHILHVGAGANVQEALEPAVLTKKGIRIGFLGCTDNEPGWCATATKPGTCFLNVGDIKPLQEAIVHLRPQVDVLILSIHWGPNMRRRPTKEFQKFAHQLIDMGVDLIHGHSAHIFQGVEVYKRGLILYDTGDFVDDYFVDPKLRNDRSFFFIVTLGKSGVRSLKMIPTLISEFQVNVSKHREQVDEMITLSQEFQTRPEWDGEGLVVKI